MVHVEFWDWKTLLCRHALFDALVRYVLKCLLACRALMEEFEDVEKLSMTNNGCLLLQVIKVNPQTFVSTNIIEIIGGHCLPSIK
jgi:hypothetical protein